MSKTHKDPRSASKPKVRGQKKGTAAAGLNKNPTLYIDNKPVASQEIDQAILTVELERSIHQASTLTMKTRDPGRILEHSGYFEQPHCEAKLDGLDFVVCDLEKTADEVTLKFEDREFALLAEDKTHFRMEHKGVSTNLQHFFKMVCAKVVPHAEFVCPELNKELPKTGPEGKTTKKKKKTKSNAFKSPSEKGLSRESFKIEGSAPDPDQLNNINTALSVCVEKNAPKNAMLGILCAGIGESKFHTHDRNAETGADGPFQLLPSTAASTHLSPYDTRGTAEHWLDTGYYTFGGGIALANSGHAPGDIAEKVEGSGAGAEFYERHRHEAEAILGAYLSGHTASTTSSSGKNEQVEKATVYELNLGKEEEENTLKGLMAYAEAINWRFFPSKGKIYFLQDRSLAAAKPSLVLDENSPGVINIDFELDKRETKKPPVVRVEARAHLWNPEIGETVKFKALSSQNPYGLPKVIAAGNWIVETIERPDTTDNSCTITCSRPEKALPEETQFESKKEKEKPFVSPTTSNPSGQIQNPGGGKLSSNSVAWKVYEQAKWISEQHYFYQEGGGHSGFHATKYDLGGGAIIFGLDCSGACSWALHSAEAWQGTNRAGGRIELVQQPLTTEGLETWGEAGVGKYITLWVKDSGGVHHCFLWIQIPSSMRPEGGPSIDYAFEASHTGATTPSPHGVGLRPRTQYYSNPKGEGFNARRWPGT